MVEFWWIGSSKAKATELSKIMIMMKTYDFEKGGFQIKAVLGFKECGCITRIFIFVGPIIQAEV